MSSDALTDLTAIPAREILGTRVLRTVVGGKTVYVQPVAGSL